MTKFNECRGKPSSGSHQVTRVYQFVSTEAIFLQGISHIERCDS